MNLDEILAGLKKEYLDGLPARLSDIRQHLRSGKLDVIKDEFHKLKGTGKTYGIPEITEVGALAETICGGIRGHVAKAVPLALDLLNAIHRAQSKQETFDVHSDPRFSELRKLA